MLYLIFFFLGLFAAVSQVVLAREFLVVFFGNEMALGSIFAAWFFWIGLGAYLYSKIASRIKDPSFWLSIAISSMAFVFLWEIIAVRNLRSLFVVPGYQLFPMHTTIFAVFLVLAPLCVLLGMVFPLGVDSLGRKEKSPASGLFMYIALGSSFGGILFSLFITRSLNHFAAVFVTSIILLITMLFSVKRLDLKRGFIYLFTASLVFSLYFAIGSGVMESYYNLKRWKSFGGEIEYLLSKDTALQNIGLGVRDGQYSLIENGQVTRSFPDYYGDAHFIHPIMLQHRKPKNILYIGLATNEMVRELKLYNINSVDFIQSDPEISKLRAPGQELHDLKNIFLLKDEARKYLKNTEKKYDLIICSLPDPNTAFLNRYYTLEFFKEAKRVLAKQGVFVTKLTSAVNYLPEELTVYSSSLYQTLKSVFSNCLVSCEENFYFFASESDYITMDAVVLQERYNARRIKSDYFNQYVFRTIFEKERIERLRLELNKVAEKFTNSDSNFVSYYFNLQYWANFTNSKLPRIFCIIFSPWIIFSFGFTAFWVLYRRKTLLKSAVNLAEITAVFTGTFILFLILLLFQNTFGSLYVNLGLLYGCFMFGIFFGIYVGTLIKNVNTSKLAMVQGLFALLALMLLLLKIIPDVKWLYVMYFPLLLLSGFLTGLIFPMHIKLRQLPGLKSGGTASKIYSRYEIGAALGAFFGVIFLVPMLGVSGCVIMLVFLNLFSGILLVRK